MGNDYKYIITDECPVDLNQDEVVEKWKRFFDDCHVDYTIKYIVANDSLKRMTTVNPDNQSLKDCPEIDFILPQIEAMVRLKRISDKELKEVELR